MEKLTKKQQILFDAIKEFINEHEYSPCIRELCELTNKKSTTTIWAGLKILKRKGYIDFLYNKNRTIKIIKGIENDK